MKVSHIRVNDFELSKTPFSAGATYLLDRYDCLFASLSEEYRPALEGGKFKLLGNGGYGMVVLCSDEDYCLKLTSDETETDFIEKFYKRKMESWLLPTFQQCVTVTQDNGVDVYMIIRDCVQSATKELREDWTIYGMNSRYLGFGRAEIKLHPQSLHKPSFWKKLVFSTQEKKVISEIIKYRERLVELIEKCKPTMVKEGLIELHRLSLEGVYFEDVNQMNIGIIGNRMCILDVGQNYIYCSDGSE